MPSVVVRPLHRAPPAARALLAGAALACGALLAAPRGAAAAERALVVVATTTLRDAGLLDALLPLFERESGRHTKLVAVGTGAALRMGAEGNADVLLTHDPERERAELSKGTLVERRPFMQNHFLIAGPPNDPARIAAAADAAAAFRRLADAQAPFVSRADESGTHLRELALREAAGIAPGARWPGLVGTGAGMGQTLLVASERRAYVLTDPATFRAFRSRIDLVPLYERDEPVLRNVYAVSRPNPERLPPGRVDVEGARRLAAFLLAPATAARIRAFGLEPGEPPLFEPIAPGAAAASAPGSEP